MYCPMSESSCPEVGAAIAAYAPRSLSAEAGALARAVVERAAPSTPGRAKALLFAAGRLAAFAEGVGLELSAGVVLREPVIERFVLEGCREVSPATGRTLRTNLRALARATERYPEPAPVALPRERAKASYSAVEIAGYLRLAAAQCTEAKRMRAAALVCLGAGAGIVASELRHLHGSDVTERSGGVLVRVAGRRARVVPVLAGYQQPLLAAAAFARERLICGGREPGRRNISDALCAALSADPSLPRLESGRLRSTWLMACAQQIGLGAFMQAAGIRCSQRLGDLAAQLPAATDAELIALRRRCMTVTMNDLARLEQVVDGAGVCDQIEARLPVGVRRRQLSARTLLLGMLLAAIDGRPGHLTRVHQALTSLPDAEQQRLGVLAPTTTGWHQLTYRQVEYTFARITRALSQHTPDGTPSSLLCAVLDRLLEASVQICGAPTSTSLTVDWTDLETWARPPSSDGSRPSRDPEAAWGHRTTNHPSVNELFYGYYLQALTTVPDEHGPEVPELVRRIHLASCQHDPPAQIIPTLQRMTADGIPPGDLLADSGYSYRQPHTFALPLRALGVQLIVDLHPNDRGPKTTHHGAIAANGALYCPATPQTLLALGPLAPAATTEQTEAHDQQCRELHRHKLAPLTGHDTDGYHRVACPATTGKLRCPLRPPSMTLPYDRPTIHQPPQHPPVCCTQKTITVPPSVNAKTSQKHDYPSATHRRSYQRRTAAERSFATTNLTRGHCRLTSLTPIALFTATTITASNLRIYDAYTARQAENQRRAQLGLPPKC
jgi:integrase